MAESDNPSLERSRAEAIRWGILAGGAVVVLFAVLYFTNKAMVLNRGLWLGSTLFYIFGMWQAQKQVESDELKDHIQPGFVVFIIANALFYVYYYFLFGVFDPELVQMQANLLTEGGQEAAKAPLPTIGKTFTAYMQSLIFGFAIAGAIALVRTKVLNRD